jgi:hypothetical protein
MSTTQYPPVPNAPYPATFDIDYPDRKLDRWSSFFRIFAVIPIAILLGMLINGSVRWGEQSPGWTGVVTAGGILFMPLILMILFRQKYPRWWFDWNLNVSRFSYRVMSYMLLLRDEYPATDEEQAVHLDLVYPDVPNQLGRGMPLVKWFLAIPHWIILGLLHIAVVVVWIIAWFAILFTGRYPEDLFDFTVGVTRWTFRVEAYALILVTDRYPPFSLKP